MTDIVVTLPASIAWEEYEKELRRAANGEEMSFKVPTMPKVSPGERCYVCHRGAVVGWMTITGTHDGSFTCTTTGRHWSGKFVKRSGTFHYLSDPIPMKGFQGYRYADDRFSKADDGSVVDYSLASSRR